jgi:hypothetical protein
MPVALRGGSAAQFLFAKHQLTLGGAGLSRARRVTTAVEQAPGEDERRDPEVVVCAEFCTARLACPHPAPASAPATAACARRSPVSRCAAQLLDACDFGTLVEGLRHSSGKALSLLAAAVGGARRLDRRGKLAIQQES